MTEQQPTHRLDVHVNRWTKDELNEPGLQHPKRSNTSFYRGTMPDCDLAALAAEAPELVFEIPATVERPFEQREYHQRTPDEGLIEVVCQGRLLAGDASPWVNSLPLAHEVFSGNPSIETSPDERRGARPLQIRNQSARDEEDLLERALSREVAPDEHLEDFYDWKQSGDEDL